MKTIFFAFISLALLNCSNGNKAEESIKNTEISAQNPETGIYKELHPNGKLKITGNLVKNIRQGLWISYYQDGKVWSETNYSDGKKHGKSTSYYTNGNLRYLGHFTEDKKDGQWFFYNEEGEFEKEIDYDTEK